MYLHIFYLFVHSVINQQNSSKAEYTINEIGSNNMIQKMAYIMIECLEHSQCPKSHLVKIHYKSH